MNNRKITPEEARAELARREAAKAELKKRDEFDNSLAGSLSKIPSYAANAAVALPGKIWDTASQVPGALLKMHQNPVGAARDLAGGLARGSQYLASALGETGQYIGDKAVNKIYKDFTGKKLNIPKVNIREELGLGQDRSVNLGRMIESENPNPLLSGVGQYGLGAASGGGNILPMMGANAAYAATQAPPGERVQAATEGAVNVGLPGGLIKAGNAIRPSNLFGEETMGQMAKNKLLKDVKAEEAAPKIEAAKRLGLSYITPAEATGNPLVAAIEGRIGRTPQGARLLREKNQERLGSEREAIDRFLETIGNKSTQKKAQSLYKETHTSESPLEFVQKLKESPIVAHAFDEVKKDKVYKQELEGIPENNFKYLDRIKQTLDDMHQAELRKGNKNKARLINEQIKNMTKEMDKINPTYKEARQYAQRNILREQIEKKIPNKEIRGSDFYRTFLANEHKFNKLHTSLKNVPEAQQTMQDMRLAFKDLVNPVSVRTSKGMAERSTSANRNMKDVAIDYLHKLEGGNYDKALVDLMTHPDWIEMLNKPKYKEGVAKNLSQALSRYTGLSKL